MCEYGGVCVRTCVYVNGLSAKYHFQKNKSKVYILNLSNTIHAAHLILNFCKVLNNCKASACPTQYLP